MQKNMPNGSIDSTRNATTLHSYYVLKLMCKLISGETSSGGREDSEALLLLSCKTNVPTIEKEIEESREALLTDG